MDREIRTTSDAWPLEDIELRVTDEGLNFRGYAAVFNSESEDMGGYREVILPGAFNNSLVAASGGKRTIKMFLNHNTDIVLGSTRAKTLRLTEDTRGLLAEADLPDTEQGRGVAEAVRRGDIDSMSFGFVIHGKGQRWSEDRKTRELTELRLFEVSPVTAWPAYPATSVSIRHLADAIGEDESPLLEAVTALFKRDARLTVEQRDLLIRAVNARTDMPLITQAMADLLARHASRQPIPPA